MDESGFGFEIDHVSSPMSDSIDCDLVYEHSNEVVIIAPRDRSADVGQEIVDGAAE